MKNKPNTKSKIIALLLVVLLWGMTREPDVRNNTTVPSNPALQECNCGPDCDCVNCDCVNCKCINCHNNNNNLVRPQDLNLKKKAVANNKIGKNVGINGGRQTPRDRILSTNPTNNEYVEAMFNSGEPTRILLLTDTKNCGPCIATHQEIFKNVLDTPEYSKWHYGFNTNNHIQVFDWANEKHHSEFERVRTYVENNGWLGKMRKEYFGTPVWIVIYKGRAVDMVMGGMNWSQFIKFYKNAFSKGSVNKYERDFVKSASSKSKSKTALQYVQSLFKVGKMDLGNGAVLTVDKEIKMTAFQKDDKTTRIKFQDPMPLVVITPQKFARIIGQSRHLITHIDLNEENINLNLTGFGNVTIFYEELDQIVKGI